MGLIDCSECGTRISEFALTCPSCGIPINKELSNTYNPGIAAILSLFIPGAGQMYKGQIKDHLGKSIVKILELRGENPHATLVILHTHTQDIRKIVDPVGKQLKHSFKIKFSFVKECGSIVNL